MIGHYVLVFVLYLHQGALEKVLWMCHFGTLIGGVGAFMRNRWVISLGLVACFGHHMFWVVDTVPYLFTGRFLVGATAYMQGGGPGAWLQSCNHFFTVPALLTLVILKGGLEKRAWIWCAAIFVVLVIISLLFLPPESNVNCVHRPWPGLKRLVENVPGLTPFSLTRYVVFITAANIVANYMLANIVLAYVVSKCLRKPEQSQPPSA